MGWFRSIKDVPKPEDSYKCNCTDGKCSNCGECCADMLPLTDKELKRIKDYAKAHNLKEHRHVPFFALNSTDMTCPFRNNIERRCDIYPVRPEICRSFICTKSLEVAHAERDQIYKGRTERSLRYEVFGNPEVLEYITRIVFIGMKER